MGDLLVRNISEAMKRSLAERADQAGRSLSDEVKAILQRELTSSGAGERRREPSALETLRSIMVADSEEEAEEYIKIMEEIEAERKRDFGRPVEDLE